MRKLVMFSAAPEYLPALREKLPGWEIIHGLPAGEALSHAADAEIVYGWDDGIASGIPGAAGKLKWVQVTSAGVDTLPLESLRGRGVFLTTASGVHANSISESVFGMMLGFSRNIFGIARDQAAKSWRHGVVTLTEIHDKAIGILGVGAIGGEIARLAKAFNMRTIGFRRSGDPAPFVDKMVDGTGLRYLLSESDFIVNILPLTPETDLLIGKGEFAAMKPSAYYITAGRGRTTDQDALIEALQNGKLAGAGLDVVTPEPLPVESPLWEMKNVFIGGHNSGGTDRYAERAVAIFMENLDDYLAGKAPRRNLVDYDRQY